MGLSAGSQPLPQRHGPIFRNLHPPAGDPSDGHNKQLTDSSNHVFMPEERNPAGNQRMFSRGQRGPEGKSQIRADGHPGGVPGRTPTKKCK